MAREQKDWLAARRCWATELGFNAAEVAVIMMDEPLARRTWGDERVDDIRELVFQAFIGRAEDWYER